MSILNRIKAISLIFLICMLAAADSSNAMENWPTGPILEKLQGYKAVMEAFRRRGERDSEVTRLIKLGAVGETNQGFLLTRFTNIPENERAFLEAENRDRQLIMIGIARALTENAGEPVNEENVKNKIPAAINYFCELREKVLPAGAWMQTPDGKWVQKK